MVKVFKSLLSTMLVLAMLLNIVAYAATVESKALSATLEWTSDFEQGEWKSGEAAFSVSDFEPGSEVVRYFKIENMGKRALSYALSFASETEVGELANVIDVYYRADIASNTSADDMTNIGTLADVINGAAFSEGNILPDALEDEGFYSRNTVVAVALKMQDNASNDYMNKSVADFSIKLTATECAYDNYPSVDKFALAFPNTDKYIYRVGNENSVKLGSLFKALDGADVGNVTITIESIDPLTDATGVYTPATVWTDGTIKFTGTGAVKVTIDDDDFANALSLNLEVINAKNLTSAAEVTSGDAVLLNDANFRTFSVSNGYTLYGNGFTLTAPNDVSYSDWGYAFVTMENGTLDNVRIVCPNFSYQVLFQSNMEDEANPKETDAFFYNVRSAVKMVGNSKVVNSYVSGGRVAIYAYSGNPVIENSTIYGGAAANIQVGTVNNLMLRDATLIQEPVQATVHDTSKTIMGLSVYLEADDSGNSSPITLEGDFVQYAWGNEEYANNYVPGAAKQFISTVLSNDDWKHKVTYKDGVERESLNLGFACIPGSLGIDVKIPAVTDNRTNKEAVPYTGKQITYASMLKASAYTYDNSNGLDPSFAAFPEYETEYSSNIPAKVTYTEDMPALNFASPYDKDNGWMSTLTVDLDNVDGGSYNFSFDKLVAKKYGRNLSYTVKDSSGNTVDKNAVITLDDSGVYEYVLEVTDNVYYGADGQPVTDMTKTYTHHFSLIAQKTSILPPTKISEEYDEALLVVKSNGGDWSCALPASLSGITIKYYSTAAKKYEELNLGSIIPTSTGKVNGTNNFWEYNGTDYTLKITCSVIHEGKGVYGMPVVVDDNGTKKMYFTISSTTGYVSTTTTARNVTLTYDFKDNNGNTLQFTKSWNVVRQDMINAGAIQYSYSDFVKGTLTDTASGGGGGCFAEGTLITLADGSQKAIEDLTFEDELLVWDFFEGKYTTSVPSLLINDGVMDWDVITLNFEDGTSVRIIYEHGFFDVEENDYVLINADNVEAFVGHTFIRNNGLANETVTLESYEITKENIGCYTILTAQHNNCIANGMLTVTPPPIDGWYDYFEIGEGMKYDEAAMEADIAKYGLYTYDDFKDYISYEEFVAFNGEYLKILVGKGYFTFDDILEQIEAFGVGATENGAVVLNDESAQTITLAGNSITAANYDAVVSGEGFEESEGGYLVKAAECDVVLTADGTASTGYAKITIGEDVYYTNQIAEGESFTLTLKNAVGKELSVESFWGNSANYDVAQDTLIESGKVVEYTYSVEITATNATETEDGYLVCGNESVFTLKALGTATMGYALITVDGDVYYTQNIAPNEEIKITVKNAKDKTVEIESFYGEFDYEKVSEEYILGNDGIIDCGTFSIKSVEGTKVVLANTTKYASETVDIYVAVYDSQNRMIAVKLERNVSVGGKAEHTFDSKLAVPENGYAKVFVWSGNGALRPVFNAR